MRQRDLDLDEDEDEDDDEDEAGVFPKQDGQHKGVWITRFETNTCLKTPSL